MRKRTAQTIEESKAAKRSASSGRSETKPKSKAKKHGRGQHPNSRKNLVPYAKGISGNPSGLPGYDVAAKIARLVFAIDGAEIAYGMAKQLKAGNAYAYATLADRAFGKIKTVNELSGPDGTPIALTVKLVRPTLKDLLK